VERLEPLAGQDLPAVDELGRDEPHRHARASSSAVLVASPRPSSSALGVASAASASRRRSAAPASPRRELRRDRRVGLGERVGEVAEDVGRVVVLDELVGRVERPPLVLLLGEDLGAELARRVSVSRSSSSSLMIRSPIRRIRPRRLLELLEQARLAALAALLELEREVVEALRPRARRRRRRAAPAGGGPVVGRGRVRVGARADRSSTPIAGASRSRPRRSAPAEAGGLAGRLGEGR
jgi:hypothetical protein